MLPDSFFYVIMRMTISNNFDVFVDVESRINYEENDCYDGRSGCR